jgi:hypothetical protein
VYTGAGKSGAWNTTVTVANPTAQVLTVQLAAFPDIHEVGCPDVCDYTHITLSPHATITLPIQAIFGTLGNVGQGADRLATLYITPIDAATLPSAKVRVINSFAPTEGVELPPVRADALAAAQLTTLTFPDAVRTSTSHTNLIIGEVGQISLPSTACAITIAAYDEDGVLRGTATPTIPAPLPLFLVDVLLQLGVPVQAGGQLQVSAQGCPSPIWGLTARVEGNSGVVSQGAVP